MKNIRISAKLIIAFVGITAISLLVVGFFSVNSSKKALNTTIFDKLTTIGEHQKLALSTFYSGLVEDVAIFSNMQTVRNATLALNAYNDSLNVGNAKKFPTETAGYQAIYRMYHPLFKKYMETHGYYDVFIICVENGHVMYTVAGENDFGENLGTGSLKNSHLAEAWKGALANKAIYVTDIKEYAPSNGAPAQFISHPIYSPSGELIGVFAIQVPDKIINNVLTQRIGLGETGETYLVSSNGYMLSDSRFQ